MLSVPVSVIFEPTVLTLVQESPSKATATTLPPPSVTTTPFVPQQTTTPIPTPTITTDAPPITTDVSESSALSSDQLRVAKLEKMYNYLGSKVRDVFQKELKKHTVDLIYKYSLQQILELPKKQIPIVDLEQESEKTPSEILKIKRVQAEKKKMSKFTIKSTDKAAQKEYDQKSALYQTMHANKKHDDAEDDDDEDPPARPNQGSKTGKSAPAKEPVEEPIAEVAMDDAGDDVVHDDDQPQDASKTKTTKTPNLDWFKQPPRPPTPDPEWNKHRVVLDQHEQPWFNEMVSATKDPLTFDDLMATPIDFSKYVLNRLKIVNLTQDILLGPTYNLLKGTRSSSIKLKYHLQECFNALTDKLDWNNPEGDRYPFDLSKPFPLKGHPGHLTVAVDHFFNNYMEYLKSFDPERTYTMSITKTKVAWYEIEGIEDTKILGVKSVSVKKLHGYGHLEEIMVKRDDRQFYKFKECDLVDLHLNDIEDMPLLAVQHKLFHLIDSDFVDFIVALRVFRGFTAWCRELLEETQHHSTSTDLSRN
ncbi:hypothetical protein Tco_1108782 [Tanacetum coccineum]